MKFSWITRLNTIHYSSI